MNYYIDGIQTTESVFKEKLKDFKYRKYNTNDGVDLRFCEEKALPYIRNMRENICFPIINRGSLWFNRLTSEQKEELDTWYTAWLNAPETLTIPTKPTWLK